MFHITAVFTIVITALSVVVALAWNEAIEATFDKIFGERYSYISKIIYALAITTIFLVVASLTDNKIKRKII